MRRPNLFIIGAAKSGTTSMYHYLSGHPQVYMSPRKEPRFFSPDLLGGRERKRLQYPHDLGRYLALFEGAADELRVGEASAQYIYSRQAPMLIHEFDPDAHIILMLRDPVDMMHSLHAHYVAAGIEPITDFAGALAAADQRRRGAGLRPIHNPLLTLYVDRARFGEQLARWYAVFDHTRIHVSTLEDMVRDPAGTYRSVLEFLGVDPDYRPDKFQTHNPRHEARSTLMRSLLTSPLPQRLRWQLLPRLVGEHRLRGTSGRLRDLNRRSVGRTALDPELRKRLQHEVAEDVALLSTLLGRDMATYWWGQGDGDTPDATGQESVRSGAAMQ